MLVLPDFTCGSAQGVGLTCHGGLCWGEHAVGSALACSLALPAVAMQVEAVENHMPEIVIVDEIGTEAEALACRTIAERGVQLVGTAHGQLLENLIKNPTLSDLVGGIESVTLGEL